MKTIFYTILAALAAAPAVAQVPPCDPSEPRVFADVPANHLFCGHIEELWRRGGTSGCRVDSDGTRFYCPSATPNRGQFAAITLGAISEPFAEVAISGALLKGEGAVDSVRTQEGVYGVLFDRDVTNCAVATGITAEGGDIAWGATANALTGGSVDPEFADIVLVETFDWLALPFDFGFSIILRCSGGSDPSPAITSTATSAIHELAERLHQSREVERSSTDDDRPAGKQRY